MTCLNYKNRGSDANVCDLLNAYIYRAWIVILSVLICLLLAVVYLIVTPKKYEISAKLELVSTLDDWNAQYQRVNITSEIESFRSADAIKAALDDLHLNVSVAYVKDKLLVQSIPGSGSYVLAIIYQSSDPKNARALVEEMIETYRSNLAEVGSKFLTLNVIEHPFNSSVPVLPRYKIVTLFSLLVGAFIGLLLVGVAHFLRPLVQRTGHAEHITGLPTVAEIPYTSSQSKLVKRNSKVRLLRSADTMLLYKTDPNDFAIHNLKLLAYSIVTKHAAEGCNVLSVLSSRYNEGKSFVTSNLAGLLCEFGKRVLIIDLDSNHSDFQQYLKINSLDLSPFVDGQAEPGNHNYVQKDLPSGADILSISFDFSLVGQLLVGNYFNKLITDFRQRYDVIMLNGPPLHVSPVMPMLIGGVQQVFLLARADYTTASQLAESLSRLRRAGVDSHIKGLILNSISPLRIKCNSINS